MTNVGVFPRERKQSFGNQRNNILETKESKTALTLSFSFIQSFCEQSLLKEPKMLINLQVHGIVFSNDKMAVCCNNLLQEGPEGNSPG